MPYQSPDINIYDGYGNGPSAVKSPSIASLTTDTSLVVSLSPNHPATYSAAASITVANNPTDIFTITGSVSQIIYITKIEISGQSDTGIGGNFETIKVIKHSTANTGGTSTVVIAVPHDSNNPAATATVLEYTANPTIGAVIGPVRIGSAYLSNGSISTILLWHFARQNDQSIILRGTSQQLAVSLGGVSLNNGTISICIEWTESVS